MSLISGLIDGGGCLPAFILPQLHTRRAGCISGTSHDICARPVHPCGRHGDPFLAGCGAAQHNITPTATQRTGPHGPTMRSRTPTTADIYAAAAADLSAPALRAPYPGQSKARSLRVPRPSSHALRSPAPGHQFPVPPADYPWVSRSRANQGLPRQRAGDSPYGYRSPGQSGHMFTTSGGPRRPGTSRRVRTPRRRRQSRTTAVASLAAGGASRGSEPKNCRRSSGARSVALQTWSPPAPSSSTRPIPIIYLVLQRPAMRRRPVGSAAKRVHLGGRRAHRKMSEWPDCSSRRKEMIERPALSASSLRVARPIRSARAPLYLGKTL